MTDSNFRSDSASSQTLWFYADGENQPVGPVSFAELQRLAATGELRPETFVIEEGGSDWKSFASAAPAAALPLSPPPLAAADDASLPWLQRRKTAFLFLILFAPFGIYLTARNRRFPIAGKAVLILFAFFFVAPLQLALPFAILMPRHPYEQGSSSSESAPGEVRGGSQDVGVSEAGKRIEKGMRNVFGEQLKRVDARASSGGAYFVTVEFKARDSLTMGMVRTDIETRMTKAYAKLFNDSGVQIERAILTAFAPLQDKYGNASEGPVYRTEMNGATGAKVRWENALALDFDEIWTVLFIDPGLRKN